jgi:hypothetical protein
MPVTLGYVGFGRPGGQKSNKSSASEVQGPCSEISAVSVAGLSGLLVDVVRGLV